MKSQPQKSNKKVITIAIIAAVVFVAALTALIIGVASEGKNTTTSGSSGNSVVSDIQTNVADNKIHSGPYDPATISGKHNIEIDIKDYGVIKVELDADVAPITVANFLNLTNDKFYDGLTFHRIIDTFMIQGGDPAGNGSGGSDVDIKGEFTNNGVVNNLQHTRGAISMARAMDPNSGSSQFFIVHQDSPHLNGDYACFGYVTEGIEIVDKICADTPVTDTNGTVQPENQPVINSIKIA